DYYCGSWDYSGTHYYIF
nr:immunoglobulin light chain junction region [Macaca mulatta]MOW00953.1 immunoglobulin light chain junction region [Macaca mulatta]MOW01659.1 immunoglobulin light chain junction region [Macaca mulatta]